jgi:hypothetical protein
VDSYLQLIKEWAAKYDKLEKSYTLEELEEYYNEICDEAQGDTSEDTGSSPLSIIIGG